MKKRRHNYLPLWTLLAVAFVAVAAMSAFGPIEVGSYTLRDSGLADALRMPEKSDAPDEPLLADGLFDEMVEEPLAPEPAPLDTAKKTILFVGDSMLEGLYPRLAAYARHNGHTLYAVIWYSSTSEVWGRSGRLKSYINKLHPDYVFVCLGANELFVKDIAAKRDGHVKTIIDEIGDIPYVWIGPPNWKPDTGINQLIAAHAAPGTFFLSDGMHFDRSADGAHPTRTSAAQWMDSVVNWMARNSAHPILLESPGAGTASAKRVFVHQPNE